MRWRDIKTGTFQKLDLRIEKTADMRILTGVLHDACFDFSQIRYTRKRLTIPLTRHPAEWENDKLRPVSLVDGELILYPVLRPCDWQITLSGEWLNKPERLARIDVIGTRLTRKVDQEGDFPLEYPPEVWYHFRLEFCNNMLPCYMDVLLRGWKDFPLIHYRDVSMPYDYETREPIHLQYNKSVSK